MKIKIKLRIDSKSSKFDTFEIQDDNGVVHFIVIGGGSFGNKGMDYERALFDEISNALHTNQPHAFVNSFVAFAHCPPIVDVEAGFGKRVQRQLTGIARNVVDETTYTFTIIYRIAFFMNIFIK